MQFSKSFCLKNSWGKKWCGFVCRFAFFLLGYCYLLLLSVFRAACRASWSCSRPPESENCGAFAQVLTPWGWAGLGLRREHRRGVREGKAPGTAVSLLSALAGVLVLAAHSVTAIPGTHRCKLPLGGFVLGSGGLFLRRGSNR